MSFDERFENLETSVLDATRALIRRVNTEWQKVLKYEEITIAKRNEIEAATETIAQLNEKESLLENQIRSTQNKIDILKKSNIELKKNVLKARREENKSLETFSKQKQKLSDTLSLYREKWNERYQTRYAHKPWVQEYEKAKQMLIEVKEQLKSLKSELRQSQADVFKAKCERGRRNAEENGFYPLEKFVVRIAVLGNGITKLKNEENLLSKEISDLQREIDLRNLQKAQQSSVNKETHSLTSNINDTTSEFLESNTLPNVSENNNIEDFSIDITNKSPECISTSKTKTSKNQSVEFIQKNIYQSVKDTEINKEAQTQKEKTRNRMDKLKLYTPIFSSPPEIAKDHEFIVPKSMPVKYSFQKEQQTANTSNFQKLGSPIRNTFNLNRIKDNVAVSQGIVSKQATIKSSNELFTNKSKEEDQTEMSTEHVSAVNLKESYKIIASETQKNLLQANKKIKVCQSSFEEICIKSNVQTTQEQTLNIVNANITQGNKDMNQILRAPELNTKEQDMENEFSEVSTITMDSEMDINTSHQPHQKTNINSENELKLVQSHAIKKADRKNVSDDNAQKHISSGHESELRETSHYFQKSFSDPTNEIELYKTSNIIDSNKKQNENNNIDSSQKLADENHFKPELAIHNVIQMDEANSYQLSMQPQERSLDKSNELNESDIPTSSKGQSILSQHSNNDDSSRFENKELTTNYEEINIVKSSIRTPNPVTKEQISATGIKIKPMEVDVNKIGVMSPMNTSDHTEIYGTPMDASDQVANKSTSNDVFYTPRSFLEYPNGGRSQSTPPDPSTSQMAHYNRIKSTKTSPFNFDEHRRVLGEINKSPIFTYPTRHMYKIQEQTSENQKNEQSALNETRKQLDLEHMPFFNSASTLINRDPSKTKEPKEQSEFLSFAYDDYLADSPSPTMEKEKSMFSFDQESPKTNVKSPDFFPLFAADAETTGKETAKSDFVFNFGNANKAKSPDNSSFKFLF